MNEFNLSNNKTGQPIEHTDSANNQSPDEKQTNNQIETKPTNKSTKDESTKGESAKGEPSPPHDDGQLNESVDSDRPLKGILKYSHSWKKRTLSESSFDNSSSFTDHEDDDNSFNLSLSCTDLDYYTGDKACKKVTFNKQISSKVFSKNQRTIESRPKKKGKKKNANKKAKGNDDKQSLELTASKQQTSNTETVQTTETKVAESLNEQRSNVSIDELSFLLYSSDSETATPASDQTLDYTADVSGNLKNNSIITNGPENGIQNDDEDDDVLLEQKIDHHPYDKENSWSEVKSSKKVKKNRKRNDSGSTSSTNNNNNLNAETSETSNAGDLDQSCDDQASKQMSLGIKNALEIQVN